MIFAATALRIATLMFLFISHIRLPASDSLIDILKNKHGRNLANKVRKIKKSYFNHKNRILYLVEKRVFFQSCCSSKLLINN